MKSERRLIDANELLSNGFITENVRFKRGSFCIPWGDIKRSVKNAPTIDAVEVVRCKDCKYCNEYDILMHRFECRRFLGGLPVRDDDFCSYGRRKEKDA